MAKTNQLPQKSHQLLSRRKLRVVDEVNLVEAAHTKGGIKVGPNIRVTGYGRVEE